MIFIKRELILNIIKKVVLPLFLGVAIYLFLRPNETIAESYFNWHLQPIFDYNKYWISKIIFGSLPDFLWLLALLNLMAIIWDSKDNIPILLKIILFTFPIISEILQFFHIISGTGDFFDILAYLIAIIIFTNFFKPKTKQ
jgi:hypothetical protein